jgi:hypothetical protein
LLRSLVAFGTLCAVVALLAPTVASVSGEIESLHVKRELAWHLFKWQDDPRPPSFTPPDCDKTTYLLDPQVTLYSTRLAKDQPYTMGGVVTSAVPSGRQGIPGDHVQVFLNETKEQPGQLVGEAVTDAQGRWNLNGSLPFDLQANHYHVVAHALDTQVDCKRYHQGWSDPEVNVTSHTRILLDGPFKVVAGRTLNVTGSLVDDVGGPVIRQTVRFQLGGQTFMGVTDPQGRFNASVRPTQGGSLQLQAHYDGNNYYAASVATSTVTVMDESVVLNGHFPGEQVQLVRSTPLEVDGQVILPPNATYAPIKLGVPGLLNATAEVASDGTFHLTLQVTKDQPAGIFTLTASGGGLRRPETFPLQVMIPTRLAIVAQDGGVGSHGWNASLTLADDTGPIANAPVVIAGPGAVSNGVTTSQGSFAAIGEASACGSAPVRATYNGTATRMPAQAASDVQICGAILAKAESARHVPWWAWSLLALPLAAWIAWRRWRSRRAAYIAAGPPLTLAFVEPRDAAQGVVGLGEAAGIVAFLEAPLPEGHRVRMGTPERMEDVEPDGLEARYALVGDAYGEIPVRAEILDARGRVVTRRTRTLRVVRYAEEIESRYKALRAGHGHGEAVSPREFEAWLRARSPDLDPAVARRLVGVFEEADYGPRVASRRELIAYLDAEAAIPQEVPPLAGA